jgi:hypothetical protein
MYAMLLKQCLPADALYHLRYEQIMYQQERSPDAQTIESKNRMCCISAALSTVDNVANIDVGDVADFDMGEHEYIATLEADMMCTPMKHDNDHNYVLYARPLALTLDRVKIVK